MLWSEPQPAARAAGATLAADPGLSLVLAGVILGGLLLGHALVARHVALEEIPAVLRARVARANRLRPWLFVVAGVMVLSGLVSAHG